MKPQFLYIITLLIIVLLAGCSSGDSNNGKNHTPVKDQIGKTLYENDGKAIELAASEKTLPSNFNDIAFRREEAPYFQYFVKKVGNQSEYKDMWNLYEFDNQAPDIDFDDDDVLFLGYRESGSGEANCPIIIKDIELNTDHETMTASLEETYPYDTCIDVETPRTSVVKVNKKFSEDVEDIVIAEDEAETNLSLE